MRNKLLTAVLITLLTGTAQAYDEDITFGDTDESTRAFNARITENNTPYYVRAYRMQQLQLKELKRTRCLARSNSEQWHSAA
jgi:hypothetical protein